MTNQEVTQALELFPDLRFRFSSPKIGYKTNRLGHYPTGLFITFEDSRVAEMFANLAEFQEACLSGTEFRRLPLCVTNCKEHDHE